MRRTLLLNNLNEVVAECERLLASGYTKSANWSLGQNCYHMRLTIEKNMDGYPSWMNVLGFPLRPFARWFALPNLLAGHSPKGIPTAGMFVPPQETDDRHEVNLLKQCIDKFLTSDDKLHAHPGFGNMSKDQFNQFHSAHASHHLSFLQPNDSIQSQTLAMPYKTEAEAIEYIESEINRVLPADGSFVRETRTKLTWSIRPDKSDTFKDYRLRLSEDLKLFVIEYGNTDAGAPAISDVVVHNAKSFDAESLQLVSLSKLLSKVITTCPTNTWGLT